MLLHVRQPIDSISLSALQAQAAAIRATSQIEGLGQGATQYSHMGKKQVPHVSLMKELPAAGWVRRQSEIQDTYARFADALVDKNTDLVLPGTTVNFAKDGQRLIVAAEAEIVDGDDQFPLDCLEAALDNALCENGAEFVAGTRSSQYPTRVSFLLGRFCIEPEFRLEQTMVEHVQRSVPPVHVTLA